MNPYIIAGILVVFVSYTWALVEVGKELQSGEQNKTHLKEIKKLNHDLAKQRVEKNLIVQRGIERQRALTIKIQSTRNEVQKHVQAAIKNNAVVDCYTPEWMSTRNDLIRSEVRGDRPKPADKARTTDNTRISKKHRSLPDRYPDHYDIIAELT